MADNQSYYDTFAETYEDGRESRYHRFLDDAEMGIVGPLAAGKDVLEVGCGTGLILERLARIARRAEGIDLSPGMLEKAKARGLTCHVASATELPYEDATFDVVCSFKVLAHVPPLDVALAEMARVCKPGGAIVAELYNANSLRTLTKKLKPATKIGDGAVNDEDVYTRYDSHADVEAQLPPGVRLERIDGIRILSPIVAPFALPGIGPVWRKLEEAAMGTPLRKFGGFSVYTMRKAQ